MKNFSLKFKVPSLKLLIALFICFGFSVKAQDTEAKLKSLSDKCAEYHRKTDGESDGYRIKIHFALDKTAANEVKQKFTTSFSNIPAYLDYKQPNWVITVGNFKTRLDAYEAFKKIQSDFPNAYIIKSKIKPIK